MLQALRERQVKVPQSELLLQKPWSVFSKACLCKAETVLRYLGRYTRKGMLHESRLQQVDETFSYRDYQDENKRKIMTLGGDEFIRRYLSHVLPKGLMRIRHFGILGNRCRKQKLVQIRSQEKGKRRRQQKSEASAGHAQIQWHCPHCKVGLLQLTVHPALKRPDS